MKTTRIIGFFKSVIGDMQTKVPIQLQYQTESTFRFNLFPNKPWFLCVCSTSLLKTLGEKEENAQTEQFLLFPQCFLPFLRPFCNFHQI